MKRSRSDLRARLEYYDRLLSKTILKYQNPVTGLLPAFLFEDGTAGWAANHAWVRDNVYSVLGVWGVAIVYRRGAESEEDREKAYNLEQTVVKLMRSLLMAMMQQANKVELFKKTRGRADSLHAKYSISTCSSVVGDFEWGHLQIDATSLYLLTLAQMIASGLQIIFTLDEVAFVQNLVFYVEGAYRIADYGIWERGDKTNHGETELNATSIGMAKAALEAINELDLFGSRGGPASVIHVMGDEIAQCNTKLISLLPRESSSKEVDAGLLTIISYPAFAAGTSELSDITRSEVITKLEGRYGCKRFLRDGYQTVKEDPHRLHYEPSELKVFENIECEWPLFFELLLLDALIRGDTPAIKSYRKRLESVVLRDEAEGIVTVPELYLVPEDKVSWEYQSPHSQDRVPGHKKQHMWSQSLYILCGLLEDGLLNIGEVDPLNRRLSMAAQPDPIVQIVLLSEDRKMCSYLKNRGITTETVKRVEHDPSFPVKILPARYLAKLYQELGVSQKMGLSGRPMQSVGVVGTSQLYRIHEAVVAFTPQFLDHESFYLCLDNRLLVDLIRTDLAYLKANWKLMGRPTIVLPLMWAMLGEESVWEKSPVFRLAQTMCSGYFAGVRVQVGLMTDYLDTASVKQIHFINPAKAGSILDIPQIDMKITRSSMLGRVGNKSFIKVSHSGSSLDTIKKSRRMTPPSKHRLMVSSSMSPLTPQPLEGIKELLASAYTSKRRSFQSDRLPVGQVPSLVPGTPRHASFDSGNIEELVQRLKQEENVYVQADILNHLHNTCGRNFQLELNGQQCSLASLLEELYQKAGTLQLWSLVRHMAGVLNKTVEDLGTAATDLLVRQKNFSVGQPNSEIDITQPLPSSELIGMIREVCGMDHSAVALTQETIVYLAMFIRSEPELFQEMLRLRVGLIQNVMVLELSRAMNLTPEQGLEQLLDLNPNDVKRLLHLIFSRKEFTVSESECDCLCACPYVSHILHTVHGHVHISSSIQWTVTACLWMDKC
jgi:phosphorylase kinase alpha/beta subunit